MITPLAPLTHPHPIPAQPLGSSTPRPSQFPQAQLEDPQLPKVTRAQQPQHTRQSQARLHQKITVVWEQKGSRVALQPEATNAHQLEPLLRALGLPAGTRCRPVHQRRCQAQRVAAPALSHMALPPEHRPRSALLPALLQPHRGTHSPVPILLSAATGGILHPLLTLAAVWAKGTGQAAGAARLFLQSAKHLRAATRRQSAEVRVG